MGVLARMLRTVDFFTPLNIGQIEAVLPHIRLYSYAAGETVFKQGEKGDAFYIVYDGEVTVKVKSGLLGLFAKTVGKLESGAFFGEIALISAEPRTATIVCEKPTYLFCLVAADFQFVLKQNPNAAAEMARIGERRKFDTSHQK